MTDKEKLEALLTEFDVGYLSANPECGGFNHINCAEGGRKIEGHVAFFTLFLFDNEGKFLKMGAWE